MCVTKSVGSVNSASGVILFLKETGNLDTKGGLIIGSRYVAEKSAGVSETVHAPKGYRFSASSAEDFR